MKRMNPALVYASQEAKNIRLIKGAHKAGLILALMVLGDQFDFTEEQMKAFMAKYKSELAAYKAGNIDARDFEAILKPLLTIDTEEKNETICE